MIIVLTKKNLKTIIICLFVKMYIVYVQIVKYAQKHLYLQQLKLQNKSIHIA